MSNHNQAPGPHPDIFDPFPSTVGTMQRAAQDFVAFLQSDLLQRPEHRRARDAINTSVKLSRPQVPAVAPNAPLNKMVVRLIQADTFSAARELYSRHPQDKIAVLNMANAIRPGGGFLVGSRAQEEDLCHCSTLYPTLRSVFYRIHSHELIYSRDVLVIKAKDRQHPAGRLMDQNEWFYTDVISCAAVNRPPTHTVQQLTNDDDLVYRDVYARDEDKQLMRAKINYILNAALQNGVQRLVLGAFGCGVFANPVTEVASIMKDILLGDGESDGPPSDWARHGLLEVVIAIFDHSKAKLVWNSFMNVFREGNGLHTTDEVDIPDFIQYTSFPSGYVARPEDAVIEKPWDPSQH